jgi:thioester reductase-like protein
MQGLAQPQHILLTGVTGFVGAHLLVDLLATTGAEIHCPIRIHHGADNIQQRFGETLEKYRIQLSEQDRVRIKLYQGDLAQNWLGLEVDVYAALARTVDVVYHSASAVNFIQPYSYMKRDNVQGLLEILHFAANSKTKPLILLSTISVYSWGHLHTHKREMREDDDIDQNIDAVITDIGYVRSKWVMEKIADLAASTGLPLMTFRLGYATCHSKTGVCASYQWWGRLVETCIAQGSIPDLVELREGLTTVDYMTAAIAHISRNSEALGKKFNLIHTAESNLTLKAFFHLLEKAFDYRFTLLPFHRWLQQWEHNMDAPLYPLLSLFKDNMYDGKSTVELYQHTYLWDCDNVKQFLRGSSIEEPVFTKPILQAYLDYLQVALPEKVAVN